MKLGIHVLGYDTPLRSVLSLSESADASAIDSVWVGEYFREAYVVAAAVTGATKRVRVGTAASLALPRSPLITAMAIRDLAELTGGRFVVGLGSQVKRGLKLWHGISADRPVAMMADYMRAVRACLRSLRGPGEIFEGAYWNLDLRGLAGSSQWATDPPLLLAAVGPKMLQVAASEADGVIGHILWSARYIAEVVEPAVASAVASRPFELATTVVVATHDDTLSARQDAKRTLGFYAATRTYLERLQADGFGDEALACAAASQQGDLGALAAAVSDDMLDTYAISCPPDELGDRLVDRFRSFETVIALPAYYHTPPERVLEQQLALIEHAPAFTEGDAG